MIIASSAIGWEMIGTGVALIVALSGWQASFYLTALAAAQNQ